jgi:hypothetical protein
LVFQRLAGAGPSAHFFGSEVSVRVSRSLLQQRLLVSLHPNDWGGDRYVRLTDRGLTVSREIRESRRAMVAETVGSGSEYGVSGTMRVFGFREYMTAPVVLLFSSGSSMEVPIPFFSWFRSILPKPKSDTRGRITVRDGRAKCAELVDRRVIPENLLVDLGAAGVVQIPYTAWTFDGIEASYPRIFEPSGCTIRIVPSADRQWRLGVPFFNGVNSVTFDMLRSQVVIDERGEVRPRDNAVPVWTDTSFASLGGGEGSDFETQVAVREANGRIREMTVTLVIGSKRQYLPNMPGGTEIEFFPSLDVGLPVLAVLDHIPNREPPVEGVLDITPRLYFGDPVLVIIPLRTQFALHRREGAMSEDVCPDTITSTPRHDKLDWVINGRVSFPGQSSFHNLYITTDPDIVMDNRDFEKLWSLFPKEIRHQRPGTRRYEHCPRTNLEFPTLKVYVGDSHGFAIRPEDYIVRQRGACIIRIRGVPDMNGNMRLGVPFLRNHIVKLNAITDRVYICTANRSRI